MLKVAIEVNKGVINNLLKKYSGDMVRKSVRSALDKTASWSKKYIAQDVSENYNLSAARVKKAIRVQRTTQTKLSTSLIISGRALSVLDDFHAWQDAVGIKANVSRSHVKSVPHAFIASVRRSGKRVIMMRTTKKRYPTTGKPGVGPSIPMLADRSKNREKRNRRINTHLFNELMNQIKKREQRASQVTG